MKNSKKKSATFSQRARTTKRSSFFSFKLRTVYGNYFNQTLSTSSHPHDYVRFQQQPSDRNSPFPPPQNPNFQPPSSPSRWNNQNLWNPHNGHPNPNPNQSYNSATYCDSDFPIDNGVSCLPIPPEEGKQIVSELIKKSELNLKEGNQIGVLRVSNDEEKETLDLCRKSPKGETLDRISATKETKAETEEIEEASLFQLPSEVIPGPSDKPMSVVGFDFGNESCILASARQRGIDVVLSDESQRETLAFVCFDDKHDFIGIAGAASTMMNPKNSISQIKTLIQQQFSLVDLQCDLKSMPYNVTEGPNGYSLIQVRYLGEVRVYAPMQVFAMMWSITKEIAEKNLNAAVNDCCIGIPVYCTDVQRRAVLDVATIAGLNPRRLFHETTATALVYGIYKTDLPENDHLNVAFVDIGHASMQVSIAGFKQGQLKVLDHTFDKSLGGLGIDYDGSRSVDAEMDPVDINYVKKCKFVVASSIFYGYDIPHQPSNISLRSEKLFCFLMVVDEVSLNVMRENSTVKEDNAGGKWVGIWRLVLLKNQSYDEPRRNGKVPKIITHRLFPHAQYSIWIDGKMELVVDPLLILERYLWYSFKQWDPGDLLESPVFMTEP